MKERFYTNAQSAKKNFQNKIDIKRLLKVVHDQKFDLVEQKVGSPKSSPHFAQFALKATVICN